MTTGVHFTIETTERLIRTFFRFSLLQTKAGTSNQTGTSKSNLFVVLEILQIPVHLVVFSCVQNVPRDTNTLQRTSTIVKVNILMW